jgi:hypothetical protein
MSITKVVVLLIRNIEKLRLHFSEFPTIYKIQQIGYTIEVTLLRQGP